MSRIFLPLILLVTTTTVAETRETSIDDYLETLQRAQERSAAQDWPAAAELWERLTAENPHQAWSWYSLGTARFNTGQFREAVAAFSKALDLGAGSLRINVAYDIARSHGMLRDKDQAIEWLEKALELGFRSRDRIRDDEAFAFLKEDVRFLALAGVFDTPRLSRAEGWRHDLAFLAGEVTRMHVDPFQDVTREEFEKQVRRLHDDIPRLNDNQTIVRLMGLLRLIGDGHTGCYPDMVGSWTTSLPVMFGLFPEGLFVIAADPAHSDLVGARVLSFGESSPEKVVQSLEPIISRDNQQGMVRSIVNFMRYPQILEGVGLIRESDRVNLTVAAPGGIERTVSVAAVPIDRTFNRITGLPGWVHAYDKTSGSLPLYLRDRRAPYWFEHLPNENTVYFQFNTVSDTPTQTLQSFVDSLFRFIDKRPVEKLVIDMRWNNGGNSRLLPPLINRIIGHPELNRTGHLFVIVGRYTYSAAMNAATFLEQQTNAILVGEPTPSSPNFTGESNMVALPWSGVRVSISDLHWQSAWPTDKRTWVAPTIFVPPTFEDYRSRRDPALEAVIGYHPTD
jgi:hypothetical protein